MSAVGVALTCDGEVTVLLPSGATVTMPDWRDALSLSCALAGVATRASQQAGASSDEVLAWLVHVQDQQSAELLRQLRERA